MTNDGFRMIYPVHLFSQVLTEKTLATFPAYTDPTFYDSPVFCSILSHLDCTHPNKKGWDPKTLLFKISP